jgi:hypothetical protein
VEVRSGKKRRISLLAKTRERRSADSLHWETRFVKILAAAVVLMTLAFPALAARDVLMVVLEDAAHEQSIRHQPSADCMAFLSAFMKHEREGVPTFLTFKTPPPVTGKVLAVYCIRPNGDVVCSKSIGQIPCQQAEF